MQDIQNIDKLKEEYLSKKPVIPCSLIVKDDGKIDICYDGFEKIPIKDITFVEEKESNIIDVQNNEDFHIYKGQIFSSEIALLSKKDIFQDRLNRNIKSKEEKKMLLGIYKLMSINIEQKDLKFSEYYLKKFKNIADEKTSNENKVNELDNLFQKIGLVIPRKIYIGGLYIKKSSELDIKKYFNNEKEYNLSKELKIGKIGGNYKRCSAKIFNQIGRNDNTQIIGGDISKNLYDEWKDSINLNNSAIIEYANLIEARDLLDDELQRKLKIPFKLLIDKRKNSKLYLKEIENNDLKSVSGYSNINIGKCEEIMDKYEYPEIYKKTFKIYTPAAVIGYYTKEFSETFDDIIVGVNIIDNRKDDYNGQWTFKKNPLLSKEISITFVSCFDRAQKYNVEIYLMKPYKL